MRRACNSRSDHVCPASARGHDYDYSYCKENFICGCSHGPRNGGEDISELRRDECSGGDAIDIVPSREFAVSDDDRKNKFVNSAERDRCDLYVSCLNLIHVYIYSRFDKNVHGITL